MTKPPPPPRHGAHRDGDQVNSGTDAGSFVADSARRARRSNPSRSVPHPHRDGAPVNTAERPGGISPSAQQRRVNGENGSFPANAAPPKRPPILVLYEDLDRPRRIPKARYGQYPPGFVTKMIPRLNCQRDKIVHVCSGCLPQGEGIRVDRDPSACPDIIADGRALPFLDDSIDGILIDPPYSAHYAREFYGFDYPRPSALLREAARVLKPGARVAIVHYITPKVPKGAPLIFVKAWGLSTGFDMPMRAVTLYQKRDPRRLV